MRDPAILERALARAVSDTVERSCLGRVLRGAATGTDMAGKNGRGAGKRVTRDVEPSALGDLLEHPPRATVAFVDRDGADVLPVRPRVRADAVRFGVRPEIATDLENREVVLVIDEGPYWFELRGLSVRGRARQIDGAEPGETAALAWYAIEAQRVLARDYGAIREV